MCYIISCDVISRIQNRTSETQIQCGKIAYFISIYVSISCVRNEIMYVLLWPTVYVLTPALFWYLYPSLFCNLENRHQNISHEHINSSRFQCIHNSVIQQWCPMLLSLVIFSHTTPCIQFYRRTPHVLSVLCVESPHDWIHWVNLLQALKPLDAT